MMGARDIPAFWGQLEEEREKGETQEEKEHSRRGDY